MTRKFIEKELLIASNNKGKIIEIKELISPYGIKILSAADLNIEEPEETGLTFKANALLKAEYYGKATGLPALADDSGLSIEALDGFPGVYSARFAGPNRDFQEAFNLIEQKLKEKNLESSAAFFTCALALWWPSGDFKIFEGKLHGKVTFPAIGEFGFGYGPIFTPEGYDKTLSQIDNDEKNKISHRSLAFKQMIADCFHQNQIDI